MMKRDNKCHLVEIGGKDMALFAEVGGTTDDVVLALSDIGYPVGAVGQGLHRHIIADSDRIRRTDTTNTEVAFDMALFGAAVLEINEVGTAGRFYD